MNNLEDFKEQGRNLIEWLAKYFSNIESYPVKPEIEPGDIEKKLPDMAPQKAESFDAIFEDFEGIIMPGITHWQHPGFHAYFPANNSYPSILAELLTAGLGVQGMKWITSPAAAELERKVMKWLQQMMGLPDYFNGVIMDTASVSSLCAILAAREKKTNYSINEEGFNGEKLRIYCSEEAHSSIEKAVRIAGIGSRNLVKIPVDSELRMIPEKLNEHIVFDSEQGYTPTCVVAALGTTGTGAIDPLEEIGRIANEHKIWFHVDAAYSGSALILPEFRSTISGLNLASSFVFNPHKWLFTNFDCSAFFVRESKDLTNTFRLVPAYLQTGQDDDIDYSNWGIQLGRRLRALKLWFVIRSFGVEGLREKLRYHIELGKLFEQFILDSDNFELVKPRNLNIVCFRYNPGNSIDLNSANQKLLAIINKSDKLFLSHTIVEGKFVIRFVCGQTNVDKKHILRACEIIERATGGLGN